MCMLRQLSSLITDGAPFLMTQLKTARYVLCSSSSSISHHLPPWTISLSLIPCIYLNYYALTQPHLSTTRHSKHFTFPLCNRMCIYSCGRRHPLSHTQPTSYHNSPSLLYILTTLPSTSSSHPSHLLSYYQQTLNFLTSRSRSLKLATLTIIFSCTPVLPSSLQRLTYEKPWFPVYP